MKKKLVGVRLDDNTIRRVKWLASRHGCFADKGGTSGEPSISRLLEALADRELLIVKPPLHQ